MKSIIEKTNLGLAKVERVIMFVSGILMFTLMTWCVFARAILNLATPYQTELAQTFHIWLCFIGSSYLFSGNENPGVEIFADKVAQSRNITFKRIYFSIIWLASLVFILPCLYYAVLNIPKYVAQSTIYLRYSYILVYGAGIIGFGLMTFRILLRVTGFWCGLYLPTDEEQKGSEA